MKNCKINLNDIKKRFELCGYRFKDDTFENAVKDFVKIHTDENGNFVPVLGEFEREPERFDTKLIGVSHKVMSVNFDDMTADIKILDTPNGKIVQQLMDMGVDCHPTIIASCEAVKGEPANTVEICQLFTIDYKGDV